MQSKRSSSSSGSSKRQRKENPRSWLENETLAFVASPLGGIIQTPVASQHDKEIFLDRLQKEIIPYYRYNKNNRQEEEDPKRSATTKTDDAGRRRQAMIMKNTMRKRIILGTNQCTRQLEKILANNTSTKEGDNQKEIPPPVPSVIVLARDIYPPRILSHIPVMVEQLKLQIIRQKAATTTTKEATTTTSSSSACHQKNDKNDDSSSSLLPILLLPGPASQELGSLFGTKRVSAILFMPPPPSPPPSAGSTSSNIGEKGDETEDSCIDHKIIQNDMDDKVTSFVHFINKTLLQQHS